MEQASAPSPLCLVVEDEVLIGMDLEDSLSEAGFDVRWMASTQSALELLTVTPFAVAVLDVAVRSESCVPLARELKRRNVPFVVYAGRPRDCGLTAFDDAPWLEKPAAAEVLVAALADIMGVDDASPKDEPEGVPPSAAPVPQAAPPLPQATSR